MVKKDHDSPPADLSTDDGAVERALASLIRTVLSRDQQLLLVAFDAIADPQVRQSLIKLARAAANEHHGSAASRADSPPMEPPDQCFQVLGEIHIRRVRGALRHLCWKDLEGQGS